MKAQFLGLAAAAVLLASTSAATAATVTETYVFTLTNLTSIYPTTYPGDIAPYPTVTGSFTVTFDPEVNTINDTTDIKVNYLNVPVGAPIGFSNYYDGNPNDPLDMSIGGVGTSNGYYNGVYYGDAGTIYGYSNDFVLQLAFPNATSVNMPSLPICGMGYSCGQAPGSFLASGYTLSTTGDAFLAQNGTNGLSGTVSTAPEPASWALMILGAGALGGALRSRRRGFAAA